MCQIVLAETHESYGHYSILSVCTKKIALCCGEIIQEYATEHQEQKYSDGENFTLVCRNTMCFLLTRLAGIDDVKQSRGL